MKPSTTSSTAMPVRRYFAFMRSEEARTRTEPPRLWPTSFVRAFQFRATDDTMSGRRTTNVGAFAGSGKSVDRRLYASETSASMPRSESSFASPNGFVFPINITDAMRIWKQERATE